MALRVTGMLAIIGALTGFWISQFLPHRYVSRATLRFVHEPGLPQDMYEREAKATLDSISASLLSDENLTAYIGRNARLREMMAADPVADIMDRLRQNTHIEPAKLPGGARGVVIRYEDELADDALDTGRELAVQMGRLARTFNPLSDGKEVTELAGFPTVEPTGATVPFCAEIGFLAGLALGALLAVFPQKQTFAIIPGN